MKSWDICWAAVCVFDDNWENVSKLWGRLVARKRVGTGTLTSFFPFPLGQKLIYV